MTDPDPGRRPVPARSPARRAAGPAALLAAAVALAGCGPSGPKLVPVAGAVALKTGKPIAHGYVSLHPDASKGNPAKEAAVGYIKDGQFVIRTGDKDGAPVGWYKVTVDAANELDPNNPYVTEWLADERYTDKNRSNLTFEVVENPEPGRYDLKLDPHPKAKKEPGAGKKK